MQLSGSDRTMFLPHCVVDGIADVLLCVPLLIGCRMVRAVGVGNRPGLVMRARSAASCCRLNGCGLCSTLQGLGLAPVVLYPARCFRYHFVPPASPCGDSDGTNRGTPRTTCARRSGEPGNEMSPKRFHRAGVDARMRDGHQPLSGSKPCGYRGFIETESKGQLPKHNPVWGRISELHARRFGIR
jgi:hypothetical protein